MATAEVDPLALPKKADMLPDVAFADVGCQRNACDADIPTTCPKSLMPVGVVEDTAPPGRLPRLRRVPTGPLAFVGVHNRALAGFDPLAATTCPRAFMGFPPGADAFAMICVTA
jgi:hypothetical protein